MNISFWAVPIHSSAFRQLISTVSIVAVVLLAVFAIAPVAVLAHAEVTASTPADGSTVQPGLTDISITFSEEISPEQSSADLVGPSGAKMSGVTAAVDRAERTKMTIKTPALTAGKYTIEWAAVTEDDNGHTNGTITFTVASEAGGGTTASPGQTTTSTSSSLPGTGAANDWLLLSLVFLAASGLTTLGLRLRRSTR